MRNCAAFLFISAFALSSFAADTGIKTLDTAWVKAMKANDLEAVMACYAPDAVLFMPGAPEAHGEKEIRASYKGLFDANTVQDATIPDSHSKTTGSLSVNWGHYTLTTAPKAGGAPVTSKGRFTGVAEKRKGHWYYISDHASAEP
jgi:uncharacterized protein (TIGR02246 family)